MKKLSIILLITSLLTGCATTKAHTIQTNTKPIQLTEQVLELPFQRGQTFRITQAHIGSSHFSHNSIFDRYAVDISMPKGTPVMASRSGMVTQIQDGYGDGKALPFYFHRANYIQIEHDDGTYGLYAHLKAGGVLVHVGDRVQEGQLIGLVGRSGYATNFHLHEALLVKSGNKMVSIQFKYHSRSMGTFEPVQNETVY